MFFESFSLFFFHLKSGVTPLYVAAQNGHEQTVQILLEKGKPNVDLADQVIFVDLISFSFSFFFLLIFLPFFVLILLKKSNSFSYFEFVDLIYFSFSFSHFLIFSFSHFLIFSFSLFLFFSFSLFFFSQKGGFTPLHIAVYKGHEQIVQILLEKGGANFDLKNQVLVFLFLNLIQFFELKLKLKIGLGSFYQFFFPFLFDSFFLKNGLKELIRMEKLLLTWLFKVENKILFKC